MIATSSSDEKLKVAKKLGTMHGINYRTHPARDEEVLKLVMSRLAFTRLMAEGLTTSYRQVHRPG